MAEHKPSPSNQRFQSHQIHTSVKQWQDRLPAERPANFNDLSDEARDAYVRLRWNVRDLRERLGKLNPMLAQKAMLNELNQRFANLEAPWNQYKASPEPHWQQLDTHTDALVASVRNLTSSNGVGASVERIEELSTDMTGVLKDAKVEVQTIRKSAAGADKKFQEIQEKLKALEPEIQAQKVRLDQMLTQHSQAFTQAEQSRAAQFSKVEQDRVTKFSESQEQRKTKFDSLVSEFQAAKTETVEKHQQELTKIREGTTAGAQELIDKLQAQLDKAEEIVGIIVKTSMSGNYQIIANREYRNAWIMRGLAIASFLAMGAMVIWAVHAMAVGPNGIDWRTVALRLSLGFAFVIPGIFCASESSRHWNQEKHNRRIALEMAALTPFIGQLDEVKQREIIEKKADEYFGRKVAGEDGEGSSSWKNLQFSGSQLSEIAQELVKIVKAK